MKLTDKIRNCSSCGAPIIWVRTAAGKSMPIDAKPEKRFIITGNEDGTPFGHVVDTFVSHFATCPNASQHRRQDG